MRWAIGYVAALALLVMVVLTAVVLPSFFMPVFSWWYGSAGTAEALGMTHEDLMGVTEQLLAYMRGRADTMQGITAYAQGFRVYGENFFTAREIYHMADVRMLFGIVFMVRTVAFWLFIALVLVLVLMREEVLRVLSRCCREVCAGFLILAGITAIVISLDFGRAWDIFHYIFFFFDADSLWRLTSGRDLMIDMVPLGFFLRLSIIVGVLLVVKCGVIIGASSWYLWYTKRDRRVMV
jgi:integral membrane protein (TIGR01906 family)